MTQHRTTWRPSTGLNDPVFEIPLVPPDGGTALRELADRAAWYPLPSVVMDQHARLADGDAWLFGRVRWNLHRRHDAASVAHIPYQRQGASDGESQ